MTMESQTFNTVWDALAKSPAEAASMKAKADLMIQIGEIIRAKGWKQAEAASHCGVNQPRVNDLLRGRVSKFSLDALVDIAAALGRTVQITLDAA